MIIENYIITKKLSLDLPLLKNSCMSLRHVIETNFKPKNDDEMIYIDNASKLYFTTNLFEFYNLLMYPFPEFYELYENIKELFRDSCRDNEKYYIQCWLNIYKKDHFINWHSHWPAPDNAWHGFFCVDCEPSKTTYRIPNIDHEVDVVSENNLLVLSRSGGDKHRTWPWEQEDRDRITIAFDIVPRNIINRERWLNHWIPI